MPPLLSLPFALPLVLVQGAWVRLTTTGAPPAAGSTGGDVPSPGDHGGILLRVGVIGESTAAGCGVATHDEGFAGHLARALAVKLDRPVHWDVVGLDGATARRTRADLVPLLPDDLDLVVLLIGVNDVLFQRPPARWRDDVTALLDDLGARAAHVVVATTPPFTSFPSLPGALARWLANTGARLDTQTRAVAAGRKDVSVVETDQALDPTGPDFFCADRFHPSAHGYAAWARAVADRVVRDGITDGL